MREYIQFILICTVSFIMVYMAVYGAFEELIPLIQTILGGYFVSNMKNSK